jgi:hypothetical protein
VVLALLAAHHIFHISRIKVKLVCSSFLSVARRYTLLERTVLVLFSHCLGLLRSFFASPSTEVLLCTHACSFCCVLLCWCYWRWSRSTSRPKPEAMWKRKTRTGRSRRIYRWATLKKLLHTSLNLKQLSTTVLYKEPLSVLFHVFSNVSCNETFLQALVKSNDDFTYVNLLSDNRFVQK